MKLDHLHHTAARTPGNKEIKSVLSDRGKGLLTHSVPMTSIKLVLGPENDKMTKKKVEIKAFPRVFGQNEYVHRVLRSKLSQNRPGRFLRNAAAKFDIF